MDGARRTDIKRFQRDLIELGINNLNIRNYLLLQVNLKGRINNI
jgi:hypothetical protein